VAWLEDSDVSDLTLETLESQFTKVKNITTESEVGFLLKFHRRRIIMLSLCMV
jgi:hypothetical protein